MNEDNRTEYSSTPKSTDGFTALNKEMDDLEDKISTLSHVFYIFIGVIAFCVVLLFINGMLVHYETGLDELDNEVFVDGEPQGV